MSYSSQYERIPSVQQLVAQDMGIMLVGSHIQSTSPLPSISVLEIFLDEYIKRGLRQQYPILEPAFFQGTVAYAYNTASPTTSNVSHRACVYSFLALMCALCEDLAVLYPFIDCELCAANARRLMAEALAEEPSLELAQAATTLVCASYCTSPVCKYRTLTLLSHPAQSLYGTICMVLPVAVHFNTFAARMVNLLGGHIMPSQDESCDPLTMQDCISIQLRNLFWVCYFIDKDLAIRTGLPACIDDSFCNLTLPSYYAETFYAPAQSCAIPALPTCTFCFDIRLCIIKSEIYTRLYSEKSLRRSEAEKESVIRHLESLLGTWKRSLPPHAQPAPIGLPHASPMPNAPPNVLRTWIEYYHCASIIHLARSHWVHRGWGRRLCGGIRAISAELMVPVEASRMILLQLDNGLQQSCLRIPLSVISIPLPQTIQEDSQL
jgi:hypothetical protein